jgi:hypothetical protein
MRVGIILVQGTGSPGTKSNEWIAGVIHTAALLPATTGLISTHATDSQDILAMSTALSTNCREPVHRLAAHPNVQMVSLIALAARRPTR